jgi:hypothetical protein
MNSERSIGCWWGGAGFGRWVMAAVESISKPAPTGLTIGLLMVEVFLPILGIINDVLTNVV